MTTQVIARRGLLAAALSAVGTSAATPRRIVVAGGGVAEILVALGLRGALVGVDSTCQFPTMLRGLPQIGYLRALSAEGVLSLRPDLLVLSHDAGPPTAVAQLRSVGVRVIEVPRVQSVAELLAAIRLLAEALDEQPAGRAMAEAVAADFTALEAALPHPARPPSALFLLAAGGGAPMASGRGTAADAMLRLAGARSAIAAYEGYRPISAEAALLAAPDWLVAPSHTLEGAGGPASLLAMPQLALLPAARAGRLVSFDTLYMLGFGPRTAHAARDLAVALHGLAELARLPARPWLADAA